MKKSLLLLLSPTVLWALDYQPEVKPTEQFIEQSQSLAQPLSQSLTLSLPLPNTEVLALDEKKLLDNPELLKRAMNSVVLTKQIEGIKVVLPIYQQLPDADSTLIRYAQSLLAHYQGKLTTAINGYRKIIAEHPEMSAVRLDLAMALQANQENEAAREQFTRLQSEDLPQPINALIADRLTEMSKEQAWRFNVDFYYRQENNINDAPEQQTRSLGGGVLIFPKAEKAHGFHLHLGANRRFNLDNNIYANVAFDASSDFYWDNHDYDDLTLKVASGVGYQDAKLTAEFQPFVKKRYFATEPYSITAGAGGLLSYRLTPKWRFSHYGEWSYETFEQRKHLNGQRQFSSLSAVYIRNPQQYWSAGINYLNSEAKDAEDSYYRAGAFIGWGQEWAKGLSSQLTLSVGKRQYNGVDFFGIRRQDKEYSTKLALWHRALHYKGITPRFVWSWNRIDSNHFYYDKTDSKVNIEFSKIF